MNIYTLARIVGGFVLALGITGLVAGNTRMWGIMNTDPMLDILRVALGIGLLTTSVIGEKAVRTGFAVFGAIYLGSFLMGLVSQSMFGMLPHEVGIADNLIHLTGGILGLVIALKPFGQTHVSYA